MLKPTLSLYKKNAVPRGVLTYTETEVQTGFMNGNLALSPNWNYMYGLAMDPKQSRVAGKFGVGPLFRGVREGVWLGGWQMTVPTDSRNKDLAKEWISWITTPAMNRDITLNFDPEPARLSVLTDKKVLAALPYLKVWQYMYQRAFPPFKVGAYNTIVMAMAGVQQSALTGQLSPSAATKAMATQIRKAILA